METVKSRRGIIIEIGDVVKSKKSYKSFKSANTWDYPAGKRKTYKFKKETFITGEVVEKFGIICIKYPYKNVFRYRALLGRENEIISRP